MKKIFWLFIISLFSFCINVYAGLLDGSWNIRANGTAVGSMNLTGNEGTIQIGTSGLDTVRITKLSSTGSLGAKSINFERRGSYNQSWIGWVSSDNQQMAGYLIHQGQEFPWSATRDGNSDLNNNGNNLQSESYLGCFKDPANPRDMSGFELNDSKMTAALCISECRSRGFSYAGTQYSSWCFCDNTYGKSGTAENCDMPCSGKASEICGGGWANSVYRVNRKNNGDLIEQPPQNQGIDSLLGWWGRGWNTTSPHHGGNCNDGYSGTINLSKDKRELTAGGNPDKYIPLTRLYLKNNNTLIAKDWKNVGIINDKADVIVWYTQGKPRTKENIALIWLKGCQ